VHRGKAFSARKEFVDKVRQCANIRPYFDTVVEALLGQAELERVTVSGPDKAAAEISCTGFFAYIGLNPNSEFISTQMERDENGCIKVDGRLRTSVPDVYAIGAVRAGYGGELSDAQEDALVAVSEIARRLSEAM
jgi:thioredoxin reductase (NADPH)